MKKPTIGIAFTIDDIERINGRKALLGQTSHKRDTVERSCTSLAFGALQTHDQRGQYRLEVHAIRLVFMGFQERSRMAQGDGANGMLSSRCERGCPNAGKKRESVVLEANKKLAEQSDRQDGNSGRVVRQLVDGPQ